MISPRGVCARLWCYAFLNVQTVPNRTNILLKANKITVYLGGHVQHRLHLLVHNLHGLASFQGPSCSRPSQSSPLSTWVQTVDWGKKTVMSTFIPILASTATPFQIQKTTELERFLTNLVLFFKKTCKSRNWVGGLFLQQLCQSSAEGNWHKIQSWGVREKVFNRYSPWFDRESSENLLRPRSRAAVPDWPSRVLQLSFSSSCLKVSTTLYSAHLCKSGKLWSLKNHSATCGRSSVWWTEAAPRRSPFPPWWLQSRAAYFGVVGVRDPWSELGDLGDFGDLGDSWSFSELRESLPALVLSCWGVRLLQSGRFGSAPVRTISELVDNGDNWWIMRIISGWWEELVDNEDDWWMMRIIGG